MDAVAPSEAVLGSEDLLSIILRHAEDDRALWCCPPRAGGGRSSGGRPRASTTVALYRALRLRSVCSMWCRAVESQLRAARSADFGGVAPSAYLSVHGITSFIAAMLSRTTSLLLDDVALGHGDLSRILGACTPSLTALSLKRCGRPDAELGEVLKCSCAFGAQLRQLSLGGSSEVGAMTLGALAALPPRSLTALDLSGCRAAAQGSPMRLEALFRACPRLARLDLSSQAGLGADVIGAVVLTLSGSLTHLSLDRCGLTDDSLGVTPEAPTGASGVVVGAAGVVGGSALSGCLWNRMGRLRELHLADNPRLSGSAVCALLAAMPSLSALDLSSSDFWPTEVPGLLDALSAAPSMRWLGCQDCGPWLNVDTLRRLTSAGSSATAHHRGAGGAGGAGGAAVFVSTSMELLSAAAASRLPPASTARSEAGGGRRRKGRQRPKGRSEGPASATSATNAAASGASVASGSAGGDEDGSGGKQPDAAPLAESWEEVADLLDSIVLRESDCESDGSDGGSGDDRCEDERSAPPGPARALLAGADAGSALPLASAVDYSRPRVGAGNQPIFGTAHAASWRSIYHVSTGDQPLYGGGRAVNVRSQTDSHGLRN